jgi:hypothetical protein
MTTQKPVANPESRQIDEYLKRPALYRNVDGTEEINIGIMGLGMAAMRFLVPAEASWGLAHGLAGSARGLAGLALGMMPFYVYFGILAAIMHFGSKAIKNRWTYRRTGFAEPRCTNRGGKWVALGAIMVVSALLSAVFALMALRRFSGGPALVGCGGALLAVVFATGIGKLPPWKRWVAAILGLGSLAIALMPSDLLASVYKGVTIPKMLSPSLLGALFLEGLWMGVVFLTSGLITLRQYIRGTRPMEPGSE